MAEYALKEWGVTCDALLRGEQVLIVRSSFLTLEVRRRWPPRVQNEFSNTTSNECLPAIQPEPWTKILFCIQREQQKAIQLFSDALLGQHNLR